MGLLSNNIAGDLIAGASEDMLQGCPDICTFKRAIKTQGAIGGTNYNWTNPTIIASNVPCNIQNVKPNEIQSFARRGIKVSNKIFVPTGVATELGDRVENPSQAGQYFVVTFISDMGGEHEAFQVYVNLIQ